MRIVVFMISLLVFSAALSEGRPIPGSSRLPGPPANRIPSEAEVTSLTDLGCCSAANLYDVPEPRGAVTSDKLEPGTRTMNPTAGNTTHTMTPATTTYTTELITESSPVEVTLETSHRLQRAHHRATTTATTVMLEESIKYLPVQLVVALVTAFLAATALSAILSVAVFAASSAISFRMPRRNRSLSGSKARLTTLQWSLLGRPAHVRLPDLEEAEGLLCPTTTVYIDDEPPRDDSDSSLQDTTALEEKSLLLLACQGELECLKAKLATAEASLETSSLENTTLRGLSYGTYGRNGAPAAILEPFSVPTLGKSQFLRLYAFDLNRTCRTLKSTLRAICGPAAGSIRTSLHDLPAAPSTYKIFAPCSAFCR